MKHILLILLLIPVLGFSQKLRLSSKSEVRILTCGPFQGELYSAFGHSAIRVIDPVTGYDVIYNYGVFDFDQPNFYLNFARGYLHYKLDLQDYNRFKNYYIYFNRSIHEQVLNLTAKQTQDLVDFLRKNAMPENQYYYYDYFYDNCATRVRDALKKALGDDLEFDVSHIDTDYTIRDLTDIYLKQQPWGDLGIDICLGLPMDKTATADMYMFLPDYIEKAFAHAYVNHNGNVEPLVKNTVVTYESTPEPDQASVVTPFMFFSFVFICGAFVTLLGYRNKKSYFGFDAFLFTVVGLVGWLLFLLWVATDHSAAADNFNLLWALPLHFPFGLLLLKKTKPAFLRYYFQLTCLLSLMLIPTWSFLPQNLHYALIPLVILIMLRSFYIQYRLSAEA